jgi:uncharacterized protein YigE (DUF2233 family)
MRWALIATLLLTACRSEPAQGVATQADQSACADTMFEGNRFTVCAMTGGRVEIRTSDRSGQPYRSFARLEAALGGRAGQVAFAMNGGMFDENGRASGLLIEDGKELHRVNRRKGGGNFHLMPNGVFLVRRDGNAEVVTSAEYRPAKDVLFATQSGPMLVIDGKLHPTFDHDGRSRHIRNGVGIAPGGTPVFVISAEPVSLGKFARFYRDTIKAKDALFFDGAVSSLWDPTNGRRDAHSELGPMVVVFRPAASAPDHEGRARP